MSHLSWFVHLGSVSLARVRAPFVSVIAVASVACSAADSTELEDAATTDAAIDVCDGIEIVAGPDHAVVDIPLRRPTTLTLPELIPAEGETRGEVDLRLDTDDLGALHVCFAAAASG